MDVAKATWFTYIHKYNDKFTCIDLSQILSKSYLAELDFNFKDVFLIRQIFLKVYPYVILFNQRLIENIVKIFWFVVLNRIYIIQF